MPGKESIRICVLGQVGVGKSSLSLQFTQHNFPTNFDPLVEDVYQKDVRIEDKLYTIHVLDTAVQDEYSPLKDLQLKEADGFMLVYNAGSIESFSHVGDSYRHIMRVNEQSLPPTVLVANQTDRVSMRQVSTSQGEALAKEFKVDQFFEVSAKNNTNVTEAFMGLVSQIIANREAKAASSATLLSSSEDSFLKSKKPVTVLRSSSPALSETSKQKTFTIGASLERHSTEESEPPVERITSRQRQIMKRVEQHKKLNELKKSGKKSRKGSTSSGKEPFSTESSGGCCIVM